MFNIISPEQFKTVPWKNGLGNTAELAISKGGSMSDFSWRVSIADMVEDGIFSNFSGYQRHLVMIAGNGLDLSHQFDDKNQTDCLRSMADVASFDGACITEGVLLAGAVKNFNVMVKNQECTASVRTYPDHQRIILPVATHCFVYCLEGIAKIDGLLDGQTIHLNAGHLLHIENHTHNEIIALGRQMILIEIN